MTWKRIKLIISNSYTNAANTIMYKGCFQFSGNRAYVFYITNFVDKIEDYNEIMCEL